MNLMDIYNELKDDIQQLEEELYASINTTNLDLKRSSVHLLRAGGKRIRPVFVLLGGKSGQYDLEKLKPVAVSLELIHMATLVHDDVIDNAETRRGKPTVKSKWDNRVAMYTGDYLLAKALETITQLDNPKLHAIFSKALVDMCLGEIEQIKALYEWNQSLRTYFLRIKRKTALLMAISCQLGGIACHADDKTVEALRRYGYYVGMAFQITDDILDFTGSEQQLGKPAGSDLLQGNVTLPVLAAFKDPSVKQNIIAQFEENNPNMKHIIQLVTDSGGIEEAKQIANRYLNKARQALQPITHSYSKHTLMQIADFIEHRSY